MLGCYDLTRNQKNLIGMYPKAEILFPPRLIPTLKDLREEEWAALVERVARLPETDPDVLAFCLMMIGLDGCMNCYAGSYKFMRGCGACARQTISQFKGTDAELLDHFHAARRTIQAYQAGEAIPALEPEDEGVEEQEQEEEE